MQYQQQIRALKERLAQARTQLQSLQRQEQSLYCALTQQEPQWASFKAEYAASIAPLNTLARKSTACEYAHERVHNDGIIGKVEQINRQLSNISQSVAPLTEIWLPDKLNSRKQQLTRRQQQQIVQQIRALEQQLGLPHCRLHHSRPH